MWVQVTGGGVHIHKDGKGSGLCDSLCRGHKGEWSGDDLVPGAYTAS